jgi:uncharacterized protein (TIGR02145 family)
LDKISIGKESYLFKSSPVGAFTAERAAGTSGASALARQAKANDVIADVLSVIKKGQLNYRVPVNTSDTSGIMVKMIPNAGDVKDADSNVYQSVRLGNQVWTVENLRTTKYRDGTPIPLVTAGGVWGLLSPMYCFYDDSDVPAVQQKWGALYNWCDVNTGKLAPTGWHVPTDAEWDTLQNYLIAKGYNWDGTTTGNKIGKSMAAKTDWWADTATGKIGKDPGMNNASGFSGISGGYRWASGVFGYQGTDGYWWSATEDYTEYAYARHLGYASESLIREIFNERMGVSVRVLRD